MRIFYSWQSDLPLSTNKNFIKTCLEAAIGDLNEDSIVDLAKREDDFGDTMSLHLDHDTKGVPGLPDLISTIFGKIEICNIFVADVSIIKPAINDERAVPNPNVLIELGYALGTIGEQNIILVMDVAFGDGDSLPFDLRSRRFPIFFDSRKTSAKEKKQFISELREAIKFNVKASANRAQIISLSANATVDEILNCVMKAPAKESWADNEQGKYFKMNPNLRFEMFSENGTQCENFKEPWANGFPAQNATGYWCDLYFGATLLKRFILVSVDGGRALLPCPKSYGDMSVSMESYKVALIHDNQGSLEHYMGMAGLFPEDRDGPMCPYPFWPGRIYRISSDLSSEEPSYDEISSLQSS